MMKNHWNMNWITTWKLEFLEYPPHMLVFEDSAFQCIGAYTINPKRTWRLRSRLEGLQKFY